MSEISCPTDDPPCRCLATGLLDPLGRKYAMDVVCVVANHGSVRFGEIADHLPDASTSTLSARLDELEAEGLVGREQYDEIPPRVEYELTDDGAELGERLRPLMEWIAARENGTPPGRERNEGEPDGAHGSDDRSRFDRQDPDHAGDEKWDEDR